MSARIAPFSGGENYQRVQKITNLEIYDDPDLLLVPEISAQVLFAWFTHPHLLGEKVESLITKKPFNVTHAINQLGYGGMMGRFEGGDVDKRVYDRCLRCIKKAKLYHDGGREAGLVR